MSGWSQSASFEASIDVMGASSRTYSAQCEFAPPGVYAAWGVGPSNQPPGDPGAAPGLTPPLPTEIAGGRRGARMLRLPGGRLGKEVCKRLYRHVDLSADHHLIPKDLVDSVVYRPPRRPVWVPAEGGHYAL
ncbi:hypothetical protein GGX14DRAFT_390371 [Mycena pura]|uniref:Uncharacterized protein n=1 Tax=Mycena pura TaxID=153505 RepID=A0AAD6YK83_9AGAR|nr:hypothetical protein GGX14DRAFT_390371 [Mycena pura]